jgi:hypothetical protein|tara:strand:+ start:641 stop:847 length:207 start_codon:yes stop_codon:yes gene_type:complete
MHFITNVIVELLTDNELDELIANLHSLDYVFTDREAKILQDAETERDSRQDTIIAIGWDEDEELETLH